MTTTSNKPTVSELETTMLCLWHKQLAASFVEAGLANDTLQSITITQPERCAVCSVPLATKHLVNLGMIQLDSVEQPTT
jgi:hypothetical protein